MVNQWLPIWTIFCFLLLIKIELILSVRLFIYLCVCVFWLIWPTVEANRQRMFEKLAFPFPFTTIITTITTTPQSFRFQAHPSSSPFQLETGSTSSPNTFRSFRFWSRNCLLMIFRLLNCFSTEMTWFPSPISTNPLSTGLLWPNFHLFPQLLTADAVIAWVNSMFFAVHTHTQRLLDFLHTRVLSLIASRYSSASFDVHAYRSAKVTTNTHTRCPWTNPLFLVRFLFLIVYHFSTSHDSILGQTLCACGCSFPSPWADPVAERKAKKN